MRLPVSIPFLVICPTRYRSFGNAHRPYHLATGKKQVRRHDKIELDHFDLHRRQARCKVRRLVIVMGNVHSAPQKISSRFQVFRTRCQASPRWLVSKPTTICKR